MRDERGVYYYAEPGNPRVRVYVRRNDAGEVEFRIWSAESPEVWEKHGWIAYDVINAAASLYRQERNANANPLKLYDLNVANALLAGEDI